MWQRRYNGVDKSNKWLQVDEREVLQRQRVVRQQTQTGHALLTRDECLTWMEEHPTRIVDSLNGHYAYRWLDDNEQAYTLDSEIDKTPLKETIMFQDALNALYYAYNNMESNHLSDDEQNARQALVGLCKEIAETYDEDIVNEPESEHPQREEDEANYQQAIKISTAR